MNGVIEHYNKTMIKKKINLDNETIQLVNTSIGRLALKAITVGVNRKMNEELDKEIKDVLPSEYIKILVKYCCVKQEGKEILLTKNEISKLTEDDFEEIAESFINNNEYLNRESEIKNIFKEGEVFLTTVYGEINTPKKRGESYQEYLLRLTIKNDLETTKKFENFQGNLAGFSEKLQESIKCSLDLGRQLSESANKIKRLNTPSFESIKLDKPIKLNPENFELTETSTLKVFQEFSGKLEELIEISASSAQFIVEANKIHTRIADEIKASSDTSTSLSKKNINTSYIVLSVTILSFVYSIYSINESNKSNAIFVKDIILKLDTINTTLKNKESNLFKRELTEINKELDSIRQLSIFWKEEVDKLNIKMKSEK